MMRVLSDVYPPEIKPVRDGLYITLIIEDSGARSLRNVRLWCKSLWCYEWGPGIPTPGQEWHWQGLAFDPAGAMPETDAETGQQGVFVPGAPRNQALSAD